jgi:antitoxin (DNA-binding transcriptional repressor) of toxin-antitoxin stability system
VRKGHTVEVLDRDTPVAKLVPFEERLSGLVVRPARGRMQDLKLPPPLETKVDVVALLREDRDER